MFSLVIAFVSNGLKCDLCQMGVNKANEEIAAGYTDQQLKDQLAQICASAPALYQSLCQEAESKADEVLAKIHAGETADQICNEEGYCGNAVPTAKDHIKAKRLVNRLVAKAHNPTYKHSHNNGLACDLCKMGVNKANEEIAAGYTDQQLKDQLAQICASAPALYQSLCQEAEGKADEVLAKIHAGEGADQICKEEGYCDSINRKDIKRHSNKHHHHHHVHARKDNSFNCDICKMGIAKLDEQIAQGMTDDQLKAELAQICASVPSFYKQLCEDVQSKQDAILAKARAGETADQICSEEGYC